MNSAVQMLLKTLGNLEQQETQIHNHIIACEKEMSGWKTDLQNLLTQKAEIQLAVALLEGTNYGPKVTSKSKKTKHTSKNS